MSPARRLAEGALLTAAALLLSWLEHLLPLQLLIPLPGVRLGLANVAVLFALLGAGPLTALSVNVCRCVLAGLLFGTPVSLLMSLSGGGCAVLAAAACLPALRHGRMTAAGMGMLAAAAHHLGQLAAAALLTGSAAVFSYLPVLLLAAVPAGWLTGSLAERARSLRFAGRENKK